MTTGLALLLIGAACTLDSPSPPAHLSDGSPARPPPVALNGVEGPSVLTRVRVVRPGEAVPGDPTTTCIGSAGAPETVAIERVDVYGTTVTYPGPERRSLHGCDAGAVSATDPTEDRPWCGRAFGLLVGGRLRDPRLSLGCRNAEGKPVGFAWIEPAAEAAYVAVSSSGYDAVYPVARRLPVRVGTDDIDLETSSATFDVTEHARDGSRLRRYELEAAVSG